MATNYVDSVNAFYLAYYGRPADPAGLAFWTQALEKTNGDFSAITSAFASSAEATARFSSESVADRVSEIYQQLFNRAPDKAGLDYWVGMIQSGSMSMASAAIEIMHGAQSSDAQISTAREQAAVQFTSAVAASGVAYDGEAAIQAARVLISAVTATSKQADIDALVTASTSLVQTAHDNPNILKALGNGTDLSTLLSTAAGKADPVGLVQALATLGKAALTDSTGLNTLLQGGGVTGLLDSLPTGTSLKDVASAVQQGGLYAGVAAAAPPPPPVVIAPSIAFVGADGKDLPAGTTLVANSIWYFIDVKGIPSGGGVEFQVSKTGNANDWTTVSEDKTLDDGSYYVRYLAKDNAGNSGASNPLKLVMDHTVAYPTVQLVNDTGYGSTDRYTSNGAVKISGLHANETWTYSFDGKTWTAGTADANGAATISASAGDGVKNLQIRTLENVNGNEQFTSTAFHYTLDTNAPAQGLKFVSVQGGAAGSTHTDLARADVVFSYTGTLDTTKGDGLFYRINTNTWSSADATNIDTVNKTVTFKDVDVSHGNVPIFIEAKDPAGNVLDVNVTISGPADTTAPVAPTVALVSDTGVSATDHITSNGTIQVTGLEANSTWQYSLDSGAHWYTGPNPDAQGAASLLTNPNGAQTLLVRSTDTSGNVSATTTFNYTVEKSIFAGVSLVGSPHVADVTTNNKGLAFQLDLLGHPNDVTTTYQVSSTGNAADFQTWDSTKSLADGTYYFRGLVSDPAGNSFTTSSVTVHLDNVAPPAPTGIQLVQDTGVVGDLVTQNGTFTVTGLTQGVDWQYSSDGKTWYQGGAVAADGTDTAYVQLSGQQTLMARTYDKAGNFSDAVSLTVTVDNHNPADGLKLDHVGATGATGVNQTDLAKADVVFSYTGSINPGDVLEYSINFGTNQPIDSTMIDSVNKTITFHDVDLSTSDPYFTIHTTDLAGANYYAQVGINGPFTDTFTQSTAAGPRTYSAQNANFYLNDGSNAPVQIHSTDASGNAVAGQFVMLGAQPIVMQGTLGLGNNAQTQTIHDSFTYSLGTTGGDTITGQHIWGFDGNDVLTASGTGTGTGDTVISGGLGEDQIHVEAGTALLLYGSVQESFLAAGSAAAHGFDTVYVGSSGSHSFMFENVSLIDNANPVTGATYTGQESGDALLALLNAAVTGSFQQNPAGPQAALVDVGSATGASVHFLVVDANSNGTVDAADYVVKIVGTTQGFSHGIGNGFLSV